MEIFLTFMLVFSIFLIGVLAGQLRKTNQNLQDLEAYTFSQFEITRCMFKDIVASLKLQNKTNEDYKKLIEHVKKLTEKLAK